MELISRIDGHQGSSSPSPFLHDPRSSGLTYETFYGLKEKPFSLSSDSRFFYHSRLHAPAFDDLLAVIRRRESLSVLTGDIGTGKTTLCRAVLQNLDRKTFSAFVPDPFASREDLLKVVLMDFGVLSVDDLTSGRLQNASRTELSYLLYEFLDSLGPLQAFAVVVIDEAQNLSLPLLEEIRILSDSDGRERQLQVVLVGQLELREKLRLPEMRQVDQRVSVHCHLAPLGADDVAGYVAHRLQTAGGSPDRIQFSREAIEIVYRASGGVPRLINRICDRALAQGHLRRIGTISREMIEAVLRDAAPPAPAVMNVTPSGPAAAVAAAVVAPAPAVAPAPPVLPDPVDEWLDVMDEEVKVADRAAARRTLRPADGAGSAGPAPFLIAAASIRRHTARPAQVLPETHMERFTNKWLRRIGIAAVWVMGLGASAVAAPGLIGVTGDLWAASTELVAPPSVPDLPPALPPVVAPKLVLPQAPDLPPAAAPPQTPR
jgi:type II secretory pathway predicted ATPase ExeA